MEKGIDCVLKSFPEEIIKSVINEQIKKKIEDIFDNDKIRKMVNKKIEDKIIPLLDGGIEKYFKVHANKLLRDEVFTYIDNGIPAEVTDKIEDMITEFLLKKLK